MRTTDLERHMNDLEQKRYEGADTREEREATFRRATELVDPLVREELEALSAAFLDDLGEVTGGTVERNTDGGVECCWALTWGELRARSNRFNGEPVVPITVRAIFPSGWTHGHLGGSRIGWWPLQVTSADDVERQRAIVEAIIEAEAHQVIYEVEGNAGVFRRAEH